MAKKQNLTQLTQLVYKCRRFGTEHIIENKSENAEKALEEALAAKPSIIKKIGGASYAIFDLVAAEIITKKEENEA